MRVAVVYKRLAETGGSERQVGLLCRELLRRGDEVHLFCASVRSRPPQGLHVHRMRGLPLGRTLELLRFSAWARLAVAREERRGGPFAVRQAFGRTAGQDVYRLGGGCHRTYLEQAHALDRPPWLRALLRLHPYQIVKTRLEEAALVPSARRRIVTNSEMTRNDLVFRYGLDRESIRVVRNGVDLVRFRPAAPGEREELREALRVPADGEVLLFLGTGYSRKGLEPALRALARLAPLRPRLRLLVAGRDRRPRAWERLAREIGLEGRVRFLGPRDDPEKLYRAADLAVLPTAYDPAANGTLEALASGLPVVTSTTNGASEILRAGVDGSVVPAPVHPADLAAAIGSWLDRGDLASARAAARARAEEFPAEERCTELLEIYAELAAAGAAGAAAVARSTP